MTDPAPAEAPEEAIEPESDEALAADVFPSQFDAPEAGDVAPGKPGKAAKPEKGAIEPEAEPEPEGEKKPDPLAVLTRDELFDAKALSGKDGIQVAREALVDARKALRETAAKTHDTYVRTQRREARAMERESEGKRYEATARSLHSQLMADVDVLANGNAEQIVETLGRLTKRSGVEVYEKMTDQILSNGKAAKARPAEDPRVAQLEAHVRALAEKLENKTTGDVRERWINGAVAAVQNAEAFPGFAYQVQLGKGRELLEFIEAEKVGHHQRTGRAIDDSALFAHLDAQLRAYVPKEVAPQAKPVPPVKLPPAQAKRLPGAGISPGRAGTAAGGQRDLTDDERFEQLVNEPDILERLGLT